MCKAPNTLPNGVAVACRECSQCRDQAINDWVGRNIAESKTAVASHAVTLTYGKGASGDSDHPRAALLTYSDIQKYLKLLRRHGYPVRYFVTGEYGSKKGRAHWHIMLYWLERVPDHVLDKNFMEQHWPHGWSFWTQPNAHAVRYNCKYIQKDMGDAHRQGHLAMSKKPPLGAAYFASLAERYVEQGLAPQDLFYSFPESFILEENGTTKPWVYVMKKRTAELFLEHFVRKWREAHPGRHLPNSELVEEFLDRGAWKNVSELDKPFVPPTEPRNPLLRIGASDMSGFYEDMIRQAKDGEARSRWEEEYRRWREGPGGKTVGGYAYAIHETDRGPTPPVW